jgi:hypothetical protein
MQPAVNWTQKGNRTQYRKEPTSRPTIYSWHKNFDETGCSVRHIKSPGSPRVSNAAMEQLSENFVRSLRDVRLGKLVLTLSQIKLCLFCYIMAVQNAVHVL